mgnify:CR=1 FL=1
MSSLGSITIKDLRFCITRVTSMTRLFENEDHAMSFFNFINSQHSNIKFSFEKGVHGKLSFLDVLINISAGKYITSFLH